MNNSRTVADATADEGLKAPAQPSARLLVTVKGNTSVTALDPVSGDILATARTGYKPHELAVSPDRRTAFVSLYGSADYGLNEPNNEIGVIDLATMTERARLDLGLYRAPHGMIMEPGGKLWVTVEESQSILVIDPDRLAIEQTIWVEVPVHFLARSGDGAKVYASHKEYPFISVIDAASRKLTARLPLPRGAQAISVSPDDTLLYVGDFDQPLLHVFECATEKLVNTIALTAVPGWPYPTPDGKYLIVTTFDEHASDGTGTGYVEILFAEGLVPHGAVSFDAEPFQALAAGDGRHIFVALADGRIPRIDLETATLADERMHAGAEMPEALALI